MADNNGIKNKINSKKEEKELIEIPIGKNLITSKWVFKVKKITSEKMDKLEVRLVARGF